MLAWRHIGACVEGSRLEIDGLNVWDFKWVRVDSQNAEVVDPRYGQKFLFHVYEIIAGENRVTFAAGEFSNSVYGFYVPVPR